MRFPNWIESQGRKPIAAQLEATIATPPLTKHQSLRV